MKRRENKESERKEEKRIIRKKKGVEIREG